MQAIGPAKAAEYAHRMGIKSNLRQHLSLVLGTSEVSPLEMATAYCPLANGGHRVEPIFILRLQTRSGRVLEENRPRLTKVIDERTAYIITSMLKGVVQPGGTGSRVAALLNRPAAGKTGSTNEYRDAWFVGYTPDSVVSVYAGHDDPAVPVGRGGGAIGGPIFANTLEKGLAGVPAGDFPRPTGITDASIDPTTGKLATPFCPEVRTELFLAGTEPKELCPLHGFFPLPEIPSIPGDLFPPGLFTDPDAETPGAGTTPAPETDPPEADPSPEPPTLGMKPVTPVTPPAGKPTAAAATPTPVPAETPKTPAPAKPAPKPPETGAAKPKAEPAAKPAAEPEPKPSAEPAAEPDAPRPGSLLERIRNAGEKQPGE